MIMDVDSLTGSTISSFIARFRTAPPSAPSEREIIREEVEKKFWWIKPADNSLASDTLDVSMMAASQSSLPPPPPPSVSFPASEHVKPVVSNENAANAETLCSSRPHPASENLWHDAKPSNRSSLVPRFAVDADESDESEGDHSLRDSQALFAYCQGLLAESERVIESYKRDVDLVNAERTSKGKSSRVPDGSRDDIVHPHSISKGPQHKTERAKAVMASSSDMSDVLASLRAQNLLDSSDDSDSDNDDDVNDSDDHRESGADDAPSSQQPVDSLTSPRTSPLSGNQSLHPVVEHPDLDLVQAASLEEKSLSPLIQISSPTLRPRQTANTIQKLSSISSPIENNASITSSRTSAIGGVMYLSSSSEAGGISTFLRSPERYTQTLPTTESYVDEEAVSRTSSEESRNDAPSSALPSARTEITVNEDFVRPYLEHDDVLRDLWGRLQKLRSQTV